MSRFPTPAHLVSWAGLSPRTASPAPAAGRGGRARATPTSRASWARPPPRRPHRHLPRRAVPADRPPPRQAKAQVAVARSILVIIWHLLADPAARYTDLGAGYYASPHRQGQEDQQPHPPARGRSATPSPSRPRPPNPIPPLTRPDHRARPGSAAARPFTAGYFPVRSVHRGGDDLRVALTVTARVSPPPARRGTTGFLAHQRTGNMSRASDRSPAAAAARSDMDDFRGLIPHSSERT